MARSWMGSLCTATTKNLMRNDSVSSYRFSSISSARSLKLERFKRHFWISHGIDMKWRIHCLNVSLCTGENVNIHSLPMATSVPSCYQPSNLMYFDVYYPNTEPNATFPPRSSSKRDIFDNF